MHFRWKLMGLIAFCSLLSTGLALFVVYWQFRSILFNEIRQKAMVVAATTAVFLDGDEEEKVIKETDATMAQNSEAYRHEKASLQKVRDANAKAKLHLHYIYTLRESDTKKGALQFVVDATDDDDENFSKPGMFYMQKTSTQFHMDQYHADEDFVEDQWGEWLSGYAPIHSKSGEVVAAVGVDIPAVNVRAELAHLRNIGLIALVISVVFSLAVAFVISTQVNRPLLQLQSAVETIGRGDLKTRVDFPRQDEFGQVGTALLNPFYRNIQQYKIGIWKVAVIMGIFL